jgi:exodeoxyribonuclease VII small subunit
MAPKQSFEKTMERLEKIVEILDSGELSLEKALEKFEEGMALSRLCEQKLDEIQKKITLLSRTPDGKVTETPLSEDE